MNELDINDGAPPRMSRFVSGRDSQARSIVTLPGNAVLEEQKQEIAALIYRYTSAQVGFQISDFLTDNARLFMR